MPKPLTGKVALVTGGSRGLGAAIAKRLAHDGAAVAFTYTSSPQKAEEVARVIESAGGRALAIRADSADVAAVRNAVAETVKAFGRLDILVNNAGVAALAPIDEFKLEDFDRLMAVNVKGVFGGGEALIDTSDAVFLMLDHQSGLIGITELRANTIAMAKLATLLKIPVITTASEPNGPNGPLMPEIHQFAPHAVYVGRKGEVDAWDNELFVKTVQATGEKTLIMAGVWTSVCVMFPALNAKAAGYKVYAVMDASGDPSEMASRTTLDRFIKAGIIPTTANAALSEVHRTWNRPEAAEIAKLYTIVAPNYAALIESYMKAQEVAKQQKNQGAHVERGRRSAGDCRRDGVLESRGK